ncbi:hypothetical protein [Nocardia sp. NPDC050435]|uniref:hypothetical protein n=1 Tax=Nocardia sp. NPDC050435 TaxID=3155040 RepID=UPI0033C115C8
MSIDEFRTDSGELDMVIVGYMHAYPRHPAPGQTFESFEGITVPEVRRYDVAAYVLVCLEMATKVTTIDVDSGTSSSRYETGMFGLSGKPHWYLQPVDVHDENGWVTSHERFAAGHPTVHLPETVRRLVLAAGRSDVPIGPVKVHNYSLDEEARRERARRQ